ncbi:YmiA family putative membrane protein [Klebsiella michiganensis]|nr:YmiA family putative membrane protein [Klebsiella michiganensis]
MKTLLTSRCINQRGAGQQERDKTEIDPVLRSKAWSAVILGLAMFWSVIALVVCNVWLLS